MKFRNNVVIKTLGIPTIYSFSDLASKLSISQSTLYTMLNKNGISTLKNKFQRRMVLTGN